MDGVLGIDEEEVLAVLKVIGNCKVRGVEGG